ncbi:NAD(P)/FAD-dependent oxidoreductase [Paenibacillus monticola]|uniref:NAD(P)-binding protein n=1 Tax=Paenibacillus monticola TaxID=2666075 RepID=A0A7X2H0N9_9BACL|nr:FAD-dependent oxidoreductase [Paenibacillus monticola]MRN51421.1 NAD(P)-binding protein [Paenibacillus monticola]
MMKHVDVVIVGAGISGLMAANMIMNNSNASVQLLDKGQSPGGRLATRRIAGGNFDHGAQFITANSDIFQAIIESWLIQGWITPWNSKDRPRYAAVGGMNQLAKRLAFQQPLECSTVVESISLLDGDYIVQARNTRTNTWQQWTAKSVLLTCPIPQMFPILESGDISIASDISSLLHKVEYKPCLAVMVCMGETKGFPLVGNMREPFPGIISWIADNRSKGISEIPSWTLHLDSDWSERHFNDTDSDIWNDVLPYLKNIQGETNTLEEQEYQIKRWRFAKAHQLISEPFLDIGNGVPLLLSGDAFGSCYLPGNSGGKVENAVLSGIAAGQYLAKIV